MRLLDGVPAVDPDQWRLAVKDGQGRRELTLAELTWFDAQVRATLDCTSGWYSRQDWTGVPLGTLLHRGPGTQSVYVHSITGYWVRFPIQDLDRLLLATQVSGAPLSADHGFPARLVAPGRRGYWASGSRRTAPPTGRSSCSLGGSRRYPISSLTSSSCSPRGWGRAK